MFENPRRDGQARNFTTNVSKILDLKSSSEQIFFRKLSLGAPAISCLEQGHEMNDFCLKKQVSGPILWLSGVAHSKVVFLNLRPSQSQDCNLKIGS